MEAYGKILLIAMPAFLVLVLFEKFYGWFRGEDTVRVNDMISSLSSGITNVTKDVLGLSVAIISYSWLVKQIAVVELQTSWISFVVAFIALDFSGYWIHRITHTYNVFWNSHIVHHSSEEFNLACALRQSISSIVKLFTIFLLPAALLGISPQVIGIVAPLHLFAQFWYHTRHIERLGFLEKIIVTPSHHRVHHAINPQYLDKNFGQIFIIWDKWFGTYQEELPDVPCVYGVTRPVRTWNPIRINFMHLWLLICDAWRAANWMDKLKIWFMPLGWRPADVAERYPVYKIDDVARYDKFDIPNSTALLVWVFTQMFLLLALISYLFFNITTIGSPGIFLYGGLVFLTIYAYTELLGHNRWAFVWELLAGAYGLFLVYLSPDWFGAAAWIPLLPKLLMGYFFAAPLISALFCSGFSIRSTVQV
ncbi:MAG: sterol desaturase family protein [Cyclobacteriaceae bacterium]